MKHKQIFNPKRFLLLVGNDLFINRYYFLVYAAAAMGILLFIYGRDAVNGNTSFSDHQLCLIGLYLIGLLFTSMLFSDLHDERKSIARLTLPSSLMEKYTSRIILSTIVFTAGWLLFFFLVSYCSGMATRFVFGESHKVLNLFDQTILFESYRYWVIQSLLLFGVIYFKKYAPAKTVIGLAAYLFFLVVVSNVIFNLFFGDYSEGTAWNISISQRTISIGTNLKEDLMGFFRTDAAITVLLFAQKVSEILFWYILMPFFWILGYVRLKEMEV